MHGELRKLAELLRKESVDRKQRRLDQCVKLAMALVGLETLRKKIHEEG
jgi:hypothetical protein